MSNLTFVVEADKESEVLAKATFYTTMPDKCSECESTDVVLDANKAEGFIFNKIKCIQCNARANAGWFKDGSGGFWKPFEKYTPPSKQATKTQKVEDDEADF